MLGRVRRSSSSLEQLELERHPPKLIKSDPLSIYETTLLKLKEGSRRDTCACFEDSASGSVNTENGSKGEEASSCDSQTQHQKKRDFSLPYLFLRYRSSHNTVSSPGENGMHIEYSCSSPCPSKVQSSLKL